MDINNVNINDNRAVSNNIVDVDEYTMRIALVGIRHADHLWKRSFYGLTSDQLMSSLREFISQSEEPEPLFYHLMSNTIVIDNLYELVTECMSSFSLKADKIIVHMIDGWEDFFIRTNYTLMPLRDGDEYEKLENYRLKTRQVLTFLINHLGEEHCITPFYQKRIFELFFIRFD